ncbi:short-chain collagen C4-like [Mytilus edulis]|uniref:short-chain collagen C4-like n=1 Tax=Mytilus edulis TaxID=6550 RepID=UPI0039EFF879
MKVQFLIVFFLKAIRCQATESVLDMFPEFKREIGRIDVLQPRIDGLQTRIDGLERENKALKARVKAGSGNTYTRWGKTSCPSTAALVYEGYAAGNAKTEKGGGANFLCLPKDPEWRSYSDSKASWIGRIFGVEYQIKDNSVYSTSFHDKEMPCSVCLITEKSTSLMVPGKVTCPTGWTKEYTGYLMSQAIGGNRQPSEYICVDENLDAVDGNKADNDQGNVYLVEGVCGSLKCPPYVGGRELTCVVCSK